MFALYSHVFEETLVEQYTFIPSSFKWPMLVLYPKEYMYFLTVQFVDPGETEADSSPVHVAQFIPGHIPFGPIER